MDCFVNVKIIYLIPFFFKILFFFFHLIIMEKQNNFKIIIKVRIDDLIDDLAEAKAQGLKTTDIELIVNANELQDKLDEFNSLSKMNH